MILNNEDWSFFALIPADHPNEPQLLQALIDSGIPFIEISDALMSNHHHKRLRRSDGSERSVPAF